MVRERSDGLFPDEPEPDTRPDGYLWARTITCPYCDGLIPLSPNWRLAPNGTGVRLRPDPARKRCDFEIVATLKEHSEGTVTGGDAKCPVPGLRPNCRWRRGKAAGTGRRDGRAALTRCLQAKVVTKTKTGKEKVKWERGYRAPLAGGRQLGLHQTATRRETAGVGSERNRADGSASR